MTGRLLVAGLVSLIVAASFVGCGEEGGSDPIVKVTRQFAADARTKQWKKVCDAMSTKARSEITAVGASVGGSSCAGAIARVAALDDSPEVLGKVDGEDVRISDVKISGDRATAEVLPSFDDVDATVHYVREDGEWKLDSGTGR